MREWLPDGHLAWLVIETVEQLDLSALKAGYRLGGVGRAAYDPAMLIAVLLYAYAVGVRSSRSIEQACETDVAFRVIAANQRPDHATLARFRAAHQDTLEGLHVQVLGLCVSAGLVDPKVVAIDSTKLAANASASANVTREQLERLARDTFAEAARIDAAEDARYGADRRGDEPAEGWEPGPGRAEKIRQALAELDAQPDGRDEIEARQQAREAAGKKRRGRKPLPADPDKPWRVANKGDKKQRKVNLTDPTSRMLKAPSRFLQGYSCQAVTDRNQIILAGTVTNQQTDNHALTPMLTAARDHLTAAGIDPAGLRVALADAGYWNSDQIDQIETDLRIIALVSTHRERTTRSNKPAPTPTGPPCTRCTPVCSTPPPKTSTGPDRPRSNPSSGSERPTGASTGSYDAACPPSTPNGPSKSSPTTSPNSGAPPPTPRPNPPCPNQAGPPRPQPQHPPATATPATRKTRQPASRGSWLPGRAHHPARPRNRGISRFRAARRCSRSRDAQEP